MIKEYATNNSRNIFLCGTPQWTWDKALKLFVIPVIRLLNPSIQQYTEKIKVVRFIIK